MSRNLVISIDEFYHGYNRGGHKEKIFMTDTDYERFLALLYLGNSKLAFSFRDIARGLASGKSFFDYNREETIVNIGAYCLMPNHFHIVMHEKIENGISTFMQKICTGYSMYFNKKYDHSGTLLQGPFGIRHLDDDTYLKYNFAYSHLNPIKIIDPEWKEKGISDLNIAKGFLANYRYSSYLDYLGIDRPEGRILNKESFPEYFQTPKEFQDFIDDWLTFRNFKDLPEASPREKQSVV